MRKLILKYYFIISTIFAMLVGVLICSATNAFPFPIKENAFEKYNLYDVKKTVKPYMSPEEIEEVYKWNIKARQLRRIKQHKLLMEKSRKAKK